MDGNYGAKSEEPLTPDERRQAGRLLSDPLSFPPEFKFWVDRQINVAKPQRRGRWKVFDTEWFESRYGEADWSGQIHGRGWSPVLPGIQRFVGGNRVRLSGGNKYIETWTNTHDDRDRQFRPHGAYAGATFGGWSRNSQVIRNRWTPAAVALQSAKTVYLETRDGVTNTKIADVADAPFTAITGGTPSAVYGYPVETTTPTTEGRVLIFCHAATTDGLFMYDPALGTTVAWVEFAAQLGALQQRGNNNLLSDQRPITNLIRDIVGLRVFQEPENNDGDDEIFDATGTSIAAMDGTSPGNFRPYIAKFSPDGKWLAYSGYTLPALDGQLWLMNMNTLAVTRLDNVTVVADTWDWAPTSDYIVANDYNAHLYVYSIPDGYAQKIADNAGGAFSRPQWRGNTLVAEYDDPTFALPRQYVEINPKTQTWTILDDHGTVAFGGATNDVVFNTGSQVLSPDGRFTYYEKWNHDDAFGNYVNDVWVTETYGYAGKAV